MSSLNFSTLAMFDDLTRCVNVLTEGTAEEEFLKIVQLHEKMEQECISRSRDMERIQKELDVSLESMAVLETNLFDARRLLETESKARRNAENELDQMKMKLCALADLMQHESPQKRKSAKRNLDETFGSEINSTSSFLSNLSITESEYDFIGDRSTHSWHKNRQSDGIKVETSGRKRSRLSEVIADTSAQGQQHEPVRHSTRRSKTTGQKCPAAAEQERICATTKVKISQDGSGAILAESTVEMVPGALHQEETEASLSTPCKSYLKENFANIINSTPIESPIKTAKTLKRQHHFVNKTFMKGETCFYCQKKIRFVSVAFRCRDCPIRCHVDCRDAVKVACVPAPGTATIKGIKGYISDYAPSVSPMVPALIVHCVNEIEARGLSEVGIYRQVSGSEREVKALKEQFLSGTSTPHLDNIDIHILCGCIKDFLGSLKEPLIPTILWKDFCNAVHNPSKQDIDKDLYKAINSLPPANRDTLALLIIHFQRIAEHPELLMSLNKIARIFASTIVGHSSLGPDQHAKFTKMYTPYTVMLNLLKISTNFWSQYVAITDDKENNQQSGVTPLTTTTPSNDNNESVYTFYATPLKRILKKRKL